MATTRDTTKRIAAPKSGLLHVEAPGCIVNIRTGLSGPEGRDTVSVEVLADADRYAGDPQWWIVDDDNNAAFRSVNVRVVQHDLVEAIRP